MSHHAWRNRLYRVTAGIGAGSTAGTLVTVIEGPEWTGDYGDQAADRARAAHVHETLVAVLRARFPHEPIVLVSTIPTSKREPAFWEE